MSRIGELERARDAALKERNRLGVELAGARTQLAMSQEQALHTMAEADDLRAEADRLRASYCALSMQLAHRGAQAERAIAEASDLRALLAEALAGRDDLRAEVERLRAELARYRPDGWRLGLPDGSHPPPAPLSDDGRQPAPPLVGVMLYRRDEA